MRPIHVALLLIATCVSLACATAPRVVTDRAADVDFAAVETFALVSDLQPADTETRFGPGLRETVRREVVGALVARGLREVDLEAADLRVRIGMTRLASHVSPVRVESLGGPQVVSRTTALRTPAGDVPLRRESSVVQRPQHVIVEPGHETQRSALVVDLFTGEDDRLVWRGTSSLQSASGRIREARLREHARAILDELPVR